MEHSATANSLSSLTTVDHYHIRSLPASSTIMDRTAAVWLGLSVVSLFSLAVVSLLKLLHTYRRHWRPLDVLLVALLTADVSSAVLAFGLALLSLIRGSVRPDETSEAAAGPICSALVCGWSAAHTLQAALLTTLMLDRTCLLRWPYKYRLSVRRTHVRYHVVVVAIISILVGVAALFAGTDSHNSPLTAKFYLNLTETVTTTQNNHTILEDSACAFLPHVLDKRFNLFWLSLHAGLLLTTLAGFVTVLVTQITAKLKGQPLGSGSDLRTLGTCASGSDNTSRGSGTLPFPMPRYATGPFTPPAIFGSEKLNHHHHPHPQHSLPKLPELGGLDSLPDNWIGNRHSTVAAVLILAYVTYHLPLLVLSIMGSFFVEYLPNWPYSATVLGLGVTQLLLVVVLMTSVDPAWRHWMSLSLKPKPKPRPRPAAAATAGGTPPLHKEISSTDEEERFRLGLYNHENTEVKFPLTNGSLFASLMAAENQGLTGADNRRGRDRKTSRMGVSAYEHRRHSHAHHALLNSFGPTSLPDSLNHDTIPTSSLSSFGKAKAHDHGVPEPHSMEPFYSDPLPSLESTPDKMRTEPIYATLSETLGSCGTLISVDNNSDIESVDANDDFVFHDTRSSRQNLNELVEVDEVEEVTQTVAKPSTPVSAVKPRVKLARSGTYRILCNGLETFVVNTKMASESQHGLVTCISSLPVNGGVAAATDARETETLARRGLITSLSMNDLDMMDDDSGQELLVTVPIKSDSMLSLYHIPSSDNKLETNQGPSKEPPARGRECLPKNLRSSIELAKYQWDDKQRLRAPTKSASRPSILNDCNLANQPKSNANGAHYRKRSHRGRTAVLKRFQQRQLLESKIAADGMPTFVSIEHLSLALTQSPVAYLDNGEEISTSSERKTVFVSEYL